MTTHELKCWPEPFAAVIGGWKRHEICVNDRDFKVGDVLELREYRVDVAASGVLGEGTYTGRRADVRVTYVSAGGTWGLPADLCVLSIALLNVVTVTRRSEVVEVSAAELAAADGAMKLSEVDRTERADRVHRMKGKGRR